MSKKLFKGALKVAGVVAAVALAIPSGGTSLLAATLGVSGIAAAGIATGLALGSSLLSRPKAPNTSPTSTDRLTANIDPKTPRKIVLGRTTMATDIRDQEFSANQDHLHRFIVCASHKVGGIDEVWLDDKLAWSQAGGVTSDFAGYFALDNSIEGSASEAVNIGPRMGSARRYTGLAYTYFNFKLTGNSKKAESPFAQSVPSRVTIIGRGALTYDPRSDSTVPGGSGPMRVTDQTTWVWNDDASRNPAIQLLWYLLGWRIRNPVTGEWRLAVGKGIPPARIDLPSFITAANLCDEPVTLIGGGTQPRYRSDGVFSEGDATSTVLEQLKASMNAELDDVDGKIRLTVLHNDLATPIADFSEDDVLSGFTWDQTAPLDETYNVVRGTFVDPSTASLFQAVDYPEVRIPSPDGIDRIETVDFQTVQDDRQAQRLVRQRIARMLYSGRFSAEFSYRAWKVQKNDVILLTFATLGWTNKLFRVLETSVQVDGRVPMVLQVEHPDIYLWDRDESPAVQPVEPTRYDPYLNPIYQDVVDPKYGDGTPIDQLKPAEAGATDGMNPQEEARQTLIELELGQLDADIAAADQAIIGAGNAIASMQSEVSGLGDRILAAEGTVNTFSQTLGEQGATITQLQTTAQTQAGQLAQFQTDLATANAAVSLNASAITGLSSSVASLGTTVTTQGSAITTAQQAITTLQGQTAVLETRVSAGNPNLAPNGGLENGLAGMTNDGFLFQVNGWGPQAYVLQGGVRVLTWPSFPVFPGTDYTVSADFAFIAGGGSCYVDLLFLDGANNVLSDGPQNPAGMQQDFHTNGDGRDQIAVTARSPAGAVKAVARFVSNNPTPNPQGTVFVGVRQMKAEQGARATSYSGEASVTQSFKALTTLDTQYATLSSTVATQNVTITAQQTAIETVQNGVTTVLGKAGVSIDVNGYVTGWEANNNGSAGDFTILADRFRIVKPGGGARTEFSDGVWRVYSGAIMKAMGAGFGSGGQFIEWAGPVQASLTTCTEQNAISYLRTDGSAYFGGSLSAGVLRNSTITTLIASDASTILGPFGSNGGLRTVIVGYDFGRIINWASQGSSGAFPNATGPVSATVVLERLQGSNWVSVQSQTITGSIEIDRESPADHTAVIRMNGGFTSVDTTGGSTVSYRVRLSSRQDVFTTDGSFTRTSDQTSQRLSVSSQED